MRSHRLIDTRLNPQGKIDPGARYVCFQAVFSADGKSIGGSFDGVNFPVVTANDWKFLGFEYPYLGSEEAYGEFNYNGYFLIVEVR